jgi:ABC-type nitrate/sulfonate/bicarbonate transport system permease component
VTKVDGDALAGELRRERRQRIERTIIVAGSAAVFLSAWEVAGRLSNPLFFAPVSEVIPELLNGLMDPRAELINGFVQTLGVLVPGFLLACVLGVGLGVLMGRSNLAFQMLEPFVTIFYNTPRVALIPILLLWLGVGDVLKITIVVLAAIFPVSVNTMAGVRDVSSQLTEPARSMGASEGQLLWKVILPSALPFIITGLKLGLGRALTTVIVAEFFVSVSGLGGILHASSSSYQMAKMLVPAVILAVMGIAIDALLTWFEKMALHRYGS